MATTGGRFTPGQASGYAARYAPMAPIDYGAGGSGYLNQTRKLERDLLKAQLAQMKQNLRLNEQNALHARNAMKPPVGARLTKADTSGMQADIDAYNFAKALHVTGHNTPENTRRGMQMVRALGIDRAHQGMMQSGQIMSAGANNVASLNARTAIPRGRSGPWGDRSYIAGTPEDMPEGPGLGYGANALGFTSMGPDRPVMPPGYTPGPRPSQSGSGLRGMATRPVISGTTLYGRGRETEARLPWKYEEGSLPGTVPKTGKTTVHKGEVVVPESQVDVPLLAYLTMDGARKGTLPTGKGSSKGYGCGSLKKGYAEGSYGEDPNALFAAYRNMLQQRYRETGQLPPLRGNRPVAPGDELVRPLRDEWGVKEPFPRVDSSSGTRARGHYYREGLDVDPFDTAPPGLKAGGGGSPLTPVGPRTPAPFQPSGRTFPGSETIDVEFSEVLRDADPSKRKRLMGMRKMLPEWGTLGKTASAGAEPAAKEFLDEIAKAGPKGAKFAGKWKALLLGAGAATALAGMSSVIGDEPRGFGENMKEWLRMAGTFHPVSHAYDYLQDPEDYNPLKSVGQRVGSGVRAGMETARGALGSVFEGVSEGAGIERPTPLAGGGEVPAFDEVAQTPSRESRPREEETTLSERDRAYGEVRNLPEQRQTKHKAEMAEVRAEEILDKISQWGHTMGKDTKTALWERAQEYLKQSTRYQAIGRGREKAVEEELKVGAQTASAIEKMLATQDAMRERQEAVELLRTDRMAQARYTREVGAMLRQAYKAYYGGTSKQKRDAKQAIDNHLMNLMAIHSGTNPDPEQVAELTDSFIGLAPEEFNKRVQLLLQ